MPDTCRRWPLMLVLLLACLACLVYMASGSTVTPSTAAPTNATVTISLGLIWDSLEAVSNFTSFSNQVLPAIKNSCPKSRRAGRTNVSTYAFTLDELPTTDGLRSIVSSLSELNFVFIGLKNSSITQVMDSLVVATTLLEFPIMQQHKVAPMPEYLLVDVLLQVIQQRVAESQFPADPLNYKAALIMDNSVSITDMYPIFSYFSEGFTYYNYNPATLEANLLSVRYDQVINIIVIVMDANQGRVIRDVAWSLGLFSSRYRWFVHGPRLINEGSDLIPRIVSENVTSIEFGRASDALAKGIWSTNGVLIYDLLSIWTPYLQYYVCEQTQPVNKTVNGFSGQFKLNPDGSATRLSWLMVIYSGLGTYRQQVGEWSTKYGFEMLPRKDVARNDASTLSDLRANTFKIATLIAPPYVQYATGVTGCSPCSKDSLTGMYAEICKLVMKNLGITDYEFHPQSDNAFGAYNGTTWNGVLKTMMDGKAMLGCAPITISTDRNTMVDFSQVIHSSRESLLLRRKTAEPLELVFQFIMPLAFPIWLAVFGALVLVALVLYAMNKLAPSDDASYNIYNSIFFTFAEMVQGTSGTTPTQISSRIVISFFWFFTLFLFLSYIANYAVFRTLDGVQQEVTSIDALIENRKYDCGSIVNTVTDSLLKSSAYLHMQQVYLLMTEAFPNGSVGSMEDALSLVNNRKRNFVLINDNLQNQYYMDMGCELVSTGDFYDLKNALVLPKGNDYGHLIDAEILRLANNISALKTKFFTVPASARQSCYDGTFSSAIGYYTPKDVWPVKPGALTLSDTLGIAVINLLGCCIAIALAGIERAIGRLQMRRSDARRRHQVVKANTVKFKRPSV